MLTTEDGFEIKAKDATIYCVGGATEYDVVKVTVEQALDAIVSKPYLKMHFFFHKKNADTWAIMNKPITLLEIGLCEEGGLVPQKYADQIINYKYVRNNLIEKIKSLRTTK